MCLNQGGRIQAGPTTTPAEKAPLAPLIPTDNPRLVGQARKRLRIDATQPSAGLMGLKIPM